MSDFDNFDELDAVRDFRSTLAVLEPDADARIRARIVELARSRGLEGASLGGRDVIELEPVVDLRDLPEIPVPATSRRLDDAPAAAVVELPAARQPSALRPTRLMAAAAAIVIVVLASTFVFRGRTTPAPDVEVNSAATGVATFAELSSVAGAQVATGLTDDKPYLHLTVRRGNLGGNSTVRTEQQRQDWIDRSDRIKTRTSATINISLGSTPTSVAGAPGTDAPALGPGGQPFAGFTYAELQALAPDANQLRAAIVTALRTQGADETRVIEMAVDLAALPVTPPAVRSALFDLLANEGFTSVGDGTDLDGRQGSAFALSVHGTTFTIVIERANATLLGYQQVVDPSGTDLAPSAAPGSVLAFAVFQSAVLTDSLT